MKKIILFIILIIIPLGMTTMFAQSRPENEIFVRNMYLMRSVRMTQSHPDTLIYKQQRFLLRASPIMTLDNYMELSKDYTWSICSIDRGVVCTWKIKDNHLFITGVRPVLDIKSNRPKTADSLAPALSKELLEIKDVLLKRKKEIAIPWVSGCLQAVSVAEKEYEFSNNYSTIFEFWFVKGKLSQIDKIKLESTIIYSKYRDSLNCQ